MKKKSGICAEEKHRKEVFRQDFVSTGKVRKLDKALRESAKQAQQRETWIWTRLKSPGARAQGAPVVPVISKTIKNNLRFVPLWFFLNSHANSLVIAVENSSAQINQAF